MTKTRIAFVSLLPLDDRARRAFVGAFASPKDELALRAEMKLEAHGIAGVVVRVRPESRPWVPVRLTGQWTEREAKLAEWLLDLVAQSIVESASIHLMHEIREAERRKAPSTCPG